MSYTKTQWVDDNPPYINAQNLNNIENGIESNDTKTTQLETEIGDLTKLTTLYKQDLVKAINEINTYNLAMYPDTLYTNSSGTNGNFTLSNSVANYDYIEIFYRDNDGSQYGQKIWTNKGSAFYTTLVGSTPIGAGAYIKIRKIYFNGTTATNVTGTELAFTDNTASAVYNIFVTKVLGYNSTLDWSWASI